MGSPKYYLLKELLDNYCQPGEATCPVPEPFPVIEIPAMELEATASVFEQLSGLV